jgi:hypothetical protein
MILREEKMVSWGYAFRRGLVIWLWTILWGIIGAVIAIAISGGSILALITNPTGGIAAGATVGIFAGIIIGALVSAIGNYAAIVKIILESEQKPAAA